MSTGGCVPLGNVSAQPVRKWLSDGVSLRPWRQLTTENLAQVLVELEPVREGAKDEEEHRKSEQQQRPEDAAGIPDLACFIRHEITARLETRMIAVSTG